MKKNKVNLNVTLVCLFFDYYVDENDLIKHNMHIDPLFLQVQFNLAIIDASPPESFHPSSPQAHYSLYPYMFDTFFIIVFYLIL